jgi:hypothetical protein
MANFQVPQFIEEKSKIIGPLTIGQFAYIATGGLLIFIAFKLLTFTPWFLFSFVMAITSVSLAFVKINGQDLPHILLSGFSYLWKPRTYTWQRPIATSEMDLPELQKLEALRRNMSIQDKLQELALSVVTGKIFSENKVSNSSSERYQTVTYLTGEKKLAKRVDF